MTRDAMPPALIAYVRLPDGVLAEITMDGWGRMRSSDPRVTGM